jgi:hypothetical protein
VSKADVQRNGHPSTSVDLVPVIEKTVHANSRALLIELEERFKHSHGTIWEIVHELLGDRKLCSRWVPQQMTEDHKKNRIGASFTHLHHFNDHGEDFLDQIFTGDETWVHQYLRQKRSLWHGSILGLPPSKNSRYIPALGN